MIRCGTPCQIGELCSDGPLHHQQYWTSREPPFTLRGGCGKDLNPLRFDTLAQHFSSIAQELSCAIYAG